MAVIALLPALRGRVVRGRRALPRQDPEPPVHDTLALREEPVAADVDPVALVREGLGDAAGRRSRLDHHGHDVGAREQFPRRREAGWPGTGDHRHPAARVGDLGCGTGQFAEAIAPFVGEVVGGSYDSIGASVVVAVTDGGETKEFYNDSWFEPGFLESVEVE